MTFERDETMLQITDDLVIKVCPGGDGDHPLIKVWSISQEADGETPSGTLVVWAEEIQQLVDGLNEAAMLLEKQTNASN